MIIRAGWFSSPFVGLMKVQNERFMFTRKVKYVAIELCLEVAIQTIPKGTTANIPTKSNHRESKINKKQHFPQKKLEA